MTFIRGDGDVESSGTDIGTGTRQTVTVAAPLLSADGDSWVVTAWGQNGDSNEYHTLKIEAVLSSGTTQMQAVSIAGGEAWRIEANVARGSSSHWNYSSSLQYAGQQQESVTQGSDTDDLGSVTCSFRVSITGSLGNVLGVSVDTRRA